MHDQLKNMSNGSSAGKDEFTGSTRSKIEKGQK